MSETFIREKLFHPFSQERPFAQGIGLGLAIGLSYLIIKFWYWVLIYLVRSIIKSPGIDGAIDVQSQVGVGTKMVISMQAPPVVHPPSSTWNRHPSAFDPSKRLTFAMVGFPEENRSTSQLVTLLRQHLQRWYGDITETDPSLAVILIVNGDVVHRNVLDGVNRTQQKILVLSSSPVDPDLLAVAQEISLNGGLCLVTLKPVGPHALARLLSKMVDSSTPHTSLMNFPPGTRAHPPGGRVTGISQHRLSSRRKSPAPRSQSLWHK